MKNKTQSFEKNIERLQRIVEQLESGELPLEQGVALYKEGLSLSAACRGQLEKAKIVVSRVSAEGVEPFDASPEENISL